MKLKVLLKLFQKLAVSKGSHLRQSLWSPSADGEILYTSSAGGEKNIPVELFFVGNPRRGFW